MSRAALRCIFAISSSHSLLPIPTDSGQITAGAKARRGEGRRASQVTAHDVQDPDPVHGETGPVRAADRVRVADVNARPTLVV